MSINCANIIDGRIAALREIMSGERLDALVVPQADPHGSEYVASHWQTRRFLSGFTGSAGPLVVTPEGAYIIADSRYWLQAADQLRGTCISVIEAGKPGAPSLEELLARDVPPGGRIGIDGLLISDGSFTALADALPGRVVVAVDDLPARLWADRPALPAGPVEVYGMEFAGVSAGEKLSKLMGTVTAAGLDGIFIARLDQIAWLLNLRAADVECNPVVISYLFVSKDINVLFVDEARLDDKVRAQLALCGVTTAPYGAAVPFLTNLPADRRLGYDPASMPRAMREAMRAEAVALPDPGIDRAKAVRNPTEMAGIRAAMVRDGIALVKGFKEIEERVAAGETLTELDVDAILTARRAEQPLFKMLSFETIAGYGPHGAIVHYEATPATSVELRPESLLLVDSGASYLDGTTDITRTIALGEPTAEMRRDYTAVLRGNIGLAMAVFPAGTRGAQLDALARIPMWSFGAHYLHGTGHGVGHYLNVHEGPQSIRLQENPQPILAGMVTSDEPGIYRAGAYGIRLENLLLAVPAFTDPDNGPFLRFETLTLYPFDSRLIDISAMTPAELAWLNAYHARVMEALAPGLTPAEAEWLAAKCAPLS